MRRATFNGIGEGHGRSIPVRLRPCSSAMN